MGSLIQNDDEQLQFFDAHDDIDAASVSDSVSDCSEYPNSSFAIHDDCSRVFQYDIWTESPESIKDRRNKFLDWMGLRSGKFSSDSSEEEEYDDRVRESSGTVLRSLEDEVSSSRTLDEKFECRIGNLDGGGECDVDEMGKQSRAASEFGEVGLGELVRISECRNNSDPLLSSRFHEMAIEEASRSVDVNMTRRTKRGWLSKLRTMSCIMDRKGEIHDFRAKDPNPICRARVRRVKVHQCKKRMKELSALYMGQDIQAHEGSILAMKFSPDGRFLASAGEDGIIRVWQVVEDERSNERDIPEIDPMCVYFTVNHLSELTPFFSDKEKKSKLSSMRKTSDSACVIFPPKVFRINEKALHEFRGHSGEILDLSWSNNNYLLSSSVDKTVRLWRVGCDHCLKIFSHNNYVTCVRFNPVDDNYFISGSIDGKVRIWAIPGCQVVDWTDIREIVTAVCYRPDGQGGIVGSMTGNCRFYNVSDNQLQLDCQICLHGKKKSPCKRVTGFQFSPQDPNKVMVTCADSQVRILHGTNVIGKYKGLRNAGSHISATFTSDGKHIVSACNDSNVYLWNCGSDGEPTLPHGKSTRASEHFSANASVAIPWCGIKCENSVNGPNALPFPTPSSFSLSPEFFLESLPKGSATWPEEKLPPSSPLFSMPAAIHKSQHKFLKASCQSTSVSHAWGLVIVTAGWDGRIRSFHNYGLPVPL